MAMASNFCKTTFGRQDDLGAFYPLAATTHIQHRNPERYMKTICDTKGTIINAAVLTANDVTHKAVQCPACVDKVFVMWPEGWDAHAAHKCRGVTGDSTEARKADFKRHLKHLFR